MAPPPPEFISGLVGSNPSSSTCLGWFMIPIACICGYTWAQVWCCLAGRAKRRLPFRSMSPQVHSMFIVIYKHIYGTASQPPPPPYAWCMVGIPRPPPCGPVVLGCGVARVCGVVCFCVAGGCVVYPASPPVALWWPCGAGIHACMHACMHAYIHTYIHCESAPREALASSCSLKSRGGSSEAGGLWSHRRATWGGISEVERHPSRRRGILQASNDCRAVRQVAAWQKAAISSGKSLLTSLHW